MNIAFLLQPKNDTAFLYDDFTLRQGLEKMKHHALYGHLIYLC